MSSKRICDLHQRELEMFCMLCKKEEEPMCAICFCEHNKKHNLKNVHISQRVLEIVEDMKQLAYEKENQEKERLKLKENAENLEEKKKGLKTEIDAKISQVQDLILEEKKKSDENGEKFDKEAEILENILSEWEQKLESCPDKVEEVEPVILEKVENQKYWEAFNQAKKVLNEEVQLDTKAINEKLNSCNLTIAEFEKGQEVLQSLNADQDEISKIKSEYDNVLSELEEQKKLVKSLNNKVRELESTNNDLENSLRSTKEKIKLIRQNNKTSDSKISDLSEENTALTNRNKETEEKLQELKEYNDKLKYDYESLVNTEKINRGKKVEQKKEEKVVHEEEKDDPSIISGKPAKLHKQSKIIQSPKDEKTIKGWIKEEDDSLNSFKLLYKGSDHGDSAREFHKRCDNQGATLVLIKAKEGYVLGGFTTKSWRSPERPELEYDQKSFIFSLTKETKIGEQLNDNSIVQNKDMGPCFGFEDNQSDIGIENNFFTNNNILSCGSTYEIPEDAEAETFFVDSGDWNIAEIEVFKVIS